MHHKTRHCDYDKGEQGWSFNPTAVGTLEERTQHDADPKGSSFLDINSGILYFKLSDTSGDWNEGIPFRGQDGQPGSSANEVLMSPDPVAYFDEIYGKASGDIVGLFYQGALSPTNLTDTKKHNTKK